MRLRTKFILFVIILHLITLVLSYFIFQQNKILFIASEVFLLISIVFAWQLYRQLIQPLQLLMQGAEAIRDKDFNVKFVTTGKYEMDELIKVYNQMIDELRGERTRQEQQHLFLEKLIYTSPTGILILDYDERIHEINPKALKLLGIEEKEVHDKLIVDLDHPVLQQIQQLKSGEAKTVTFNGVNTFKIQKSHFIDRGFARHFVMLEELTAEILAAEKKAYGKVIRMMAHEVNNTIGPVNSIIQSTLDSKKIWTGQQDEPLREALEVALNRNGNLNLFMRNFAEVVRLPQPKMIAIDLHKMIYAITRLMEIRAAEKQVIFEYYLSENNFIINGDEQQIEQVLINVVKNAIESIEVK
ncbi:MAG: HAMP domain-containing protein, partial [Ferruginibacter sp.]